MNMNSGNAYDYITTVTIGMTACPSSLDSPGPKWYKLEATSELTNELAGTFDTPVSRSEAHLCEGVNIHLNLHVYHLISATLS